MSPLHFTCNYKGYSELSVDTEHSLHCIPFEHFSKFGTCKDREVEMFDKEFQRPGYIGTKVIRTKLVQIDEFV